MSPFSGNERVGPTSVMEAVTLLLEAATCEAMPIKPAAHGAAAPGSKISDAKSCRMALKKKGIDEKHRQWLARLVTTRRIVVIPTANALGYYQNKREENGIDPNRYVFVYNTMMNKRSILTRALYFDRDFPIDVTDEKICMQTIAGRSINEIFREHMFQLALTFHGGTEVIGYEWGAPSFLHKWSPDDTAQAAIAHSYSRFGGGWSQSKAYDVGTMNDKVYYVRGGMEDWAYCGKNQKTDFSNLVLSHSNMFSPDA